MRHRNLNLVHPARIAVRRLPVRTPCPHRLYVWGCNASDRRWSGVIINGSVREHSPLLDELITAADGLSTTEVETPAGGTGETPQVRAEGDPVGVSVGRGLPVALTGGWLAAGPLDPLPLALPVCVGVAVSLTTIASKRLCLSRVCMERSAEPTASARLRSALSMCPSSGSLLSYTGGSVRLAPCGNGNGSNYLASDEITVGAL